MAYRGKSRRYDTELVTGNDVSGMSDRESTLAAEMPRKK